MLKVATVHCKHILSKSGLVANGYAANPYVGCAHNCRYCYASFMLRYTGHSEPWGSFVDVKYWEKLAPNVSLAGKDIYIGTVTDPYQPLEAQYLRTQSLLQALQDKGARISIITKSDLILRDLELIRSIPGIKVIWSINTHEDSLRREWDQSADISAKIHAMQVFYQAGVPTACFIAPIFPGLTRASVIISTVKTQCNEIWLDRLNLRSQNKLPVLQYIKKNYPHLYPLYCSIYLRQDNRYWTMLAQKLRTFTTQIGLPFNPDVLANPPFNPPVVSCFFAPRLKAPAIQGQLSFDD